jgi:hypothetical protein
VPALLRRTTRTAVITAVLVGVPAVAAQAAAGLQASVASSPMPVSTGTWKAVAASSPGDAPGRTGPLWVTGGWGDDRSRYAYFWVVNTGSLPVDSVTYSVDAFGEDITLQACSGTWNTRGGCTGGTITTVPIDRATSGPRAPRQAVHLRLSSRYGTWTAARVSVSVDRPAP